MSPEGGPFRLRAARLEDADALAPRLRAADRRELQALGLDPRTALAASVQASRRAMAGLDAAGRVVALLGVGSAPDDPRIGGPWLLGAEEMARQPRAVMRLARAELPRLSEGFDLLLNRADARNRMHIAWAQALGFRCLRSMPLGPERRLFIEFARLV